MIQHHGDFAVALPSGWTAPQFGFGQTVQVREKTGQVTGLDHYTSEQAAALQTTEGWWYFVFETRTLTDGRVIADIAGYHESVIQAVPYLSEVKYKSRVAV